MTAPAMSALLMLLAALTAAPACAEDAQIWASASTSGSLRGPLELHVDVNARWFDNGAHLGHFQLRGLLGWRFKPELLAGAGYSYVRSETLAGLVAHEHRIFQQLNFPIASIGKARLVGRTRFEQRMFEEQAGMALRLRQQVRLNIPLEGPQGLRAILHTEPYFLLNQPTPIAPTGFNQIRTFAGLGIPLLGRTALEAGYMNQTFVSGATRTNHAVSLGLGTSF